MSGRGYFSFEWDLSDSWAYGAAAEVEEDFGF